MNAHQIILIKRSWRILRNIDPVLLGGVFYDKLFAEHPALKRMFKTSSLAQAQKLVDMLSSIVMNLDHLEDFTDMIQNLALRHEDYGVKPGHYKAVGAALLWTLQQGLGSDWNKDVEEAWSTCYGILAATMIQATQKKQER